MSQPGQDDPERTELLATRAPVASVEHGEVLPPGARLGDYRIEALLGQGGMGDVYRAEQLEPVHRTVALKLLRGQRLDARHVAYFEVERQLLAQMRHPAIAQIFDAGTTPDGQPYFAMEFIAGSPITDYCDRHALTLDARIALFIRVCEGVQHAHQKGVIHRDLKPGNLLVDEVDGRALPKIIDFGIATATTLGQGREIAGTPDYMSPEQAGGDQSLVDTRSDVYALGVVLCELLTGKRPQIAGETVTGGRHTLRLPSQQLATLPPGEAAQRAQECGQPLAQMRKLLRSELDHVVARAMAHERGERYPSAAALAEDLRRFLDHQPLQAVPRSRRYAWRKFAQRHRTGIAAASVVAVALVVGLALSIYGLLQARAQRAIALQRSAQLERMADFQQSMLEGIDIQAMGIGMGRGLRAQLARNDAGRLQAFDAALAQTSTADVARSLVDQDILVSAEQAIARDFRDDPALAADLRESVAKVRLALGLPKQAAAGLAEVADYRARALGADAVKTLEARQLQARALLDDARPQQALRVASDGLRHARRLPVADATRVRLALAQAQAIAALGDRPRARALVEALRGLTLRHRGASDPVALDVTSYLGTLLGTMGEPKAGRALLESVVTTRLELHGQDNPDTLAAQHNLAVMRILTGDADGAVTLQRKLVAAQTRRLGAEHPTTLLETGNLANMLVDSGKPEQALPLAERVVEADVRVQGADNPQTLRAKLNLATVYARLHRFDDAMALQLEVAAARTRLLGADHPDTVYIQINRAATLYQAHRAREALALLARELPIAERVLGAHHPQLQMGYDIRAQAADELGDRALAIASWRHLLKIRLAAYGAGDVKTVDSAWQLEGLLRQGGQVKEADALRADYVIPLLQADPATLDAAHRKMQKNIRDTEREEAAAAARS